MKILQKLKQNKITFIILWWLILCCFSFIWINTYQVPKDVFFNFACLGIFAVLIILSSPLKIKPLELLLPIGYVCAKLGYIFNNWDGMGYQYKLYLGSKFLLIALFMVILFDAYEKKRTINIDRRMLPFIITTFVMIVLMAFMNSGSIVIILAPALAVLILDLSLDEINKQCKYITLSAYLNFVTLMTYSLIFASEQTGKLDSRWVGIFVFPIAGGTTASIALIGLIYKVIMIKRHCAKEKKKKYLLITCALMIYPLVSMVLIENKTSGVALLASVLMAWAFAGKENLSKDKIYKRFFVMIAGFMIAILLAVGIFAIFSMLRPYILKMDNGVVKTALLYISNKGVGIVNGTDYYGEFTNNHLLKSIDAALSSRLSLWVRGVKQIGILGNTDPFIYSATGEFLDSHVHNTYIAWLIRYGAIIGACAIIWVIWLLVKFCKTMVEHREECLLGFLWVSFAVQFCIFENELWETAVLFGSLAFIKLLLCSYKNTEKNIDNLR